MLLREIVFPLLKIFSRGIFGFSRPTHPMLDRTTFLRNVWQVSCRKFRNQISLRFDFTNFTAGRNGLILCAPCALHTLRAALCPLLPSGISPSCSYPSGVQAPLRGTSTPPGHKQKIRGRCSFGAPLLRHPKPPAGNGSGYSPKEALGHGMASKLDIEV